MKRAEQGFTITEVFIFLAVSGVMFTIAFIGSQGQVNSVAFRQGMNSVEMKIREVFNNVDNGYFGNAGNLECTAEISNDGDDWVKSGAGGGTSSSCVYMGKVIYFTPTTMEIRALIGARDKTAKTLNSTPLNERFNLSNGLTFTAAKTMDITAATLSLSDINHIKILTYREQDSTDVDVSTNIQASRYYYSSDDSDDTNWPTTAPIKIISTKTPILCFAYNNQKGWLKITQGDIEVSYTGEGC